MAYDPRSASNPQRIPQEVPSKRAQEQPAPDQETPAQA